jgi:hypothetical protein
MRLVLGIAYTGKNKFKQFDYYQYQYLDTILKLLTGAKKTEKTG